MNSGPLRAFAFQSDRLNATGQVNARFIRSRRLTANDVLANNVRANCVVTGGIEAENLRANQITAGEFMAVDFQADTFTGTDLVTEMFESMDIDVEDIPMDEAQDHPHENPLQQQFPQQQPPQQDPPQQPQQHHRRNNRRKSNFNEGDRRQMPLVVFGAGMIGADNMPFAGHMSGVTGKILKQLRVREGRGECCVLMIDLMIDEFKTSKVSISEIRFLNLKTNHPIYQGVSTLPS